MARNHHRGPHPGPKKSSHKGQRRARSSSDPQNQGFNVAQNLDNYPGRELEAGRFDGKRFNILVDRVPYLVRAAPFTFNGEKRYRVSFNGSSEHVFTWDSSLGQLRAINDDSSTLPDNLELAISEKLQSRV